MPFHSTADNDHERDEELQWSRILRSGDERSGMALVFRAP